MRESAGTDLLTVAVKISSSRRSEPRTPVAPLAALLIVQVLFATFPVLGKLAMREMPPLVLASFRAVFGALLLTAIARWVEGPAPSPSRLEKLALFGLSLLGIAANQLFFITGLNATSATNATLLVATIPIFTLAIAVATRAERVGARRLLGIPVAVAGVFTLLDLSLVSLGGPTLKGDLLVATNSLFYATYLVLARRILRARPPFDFTARLFRYGAIPILIVALPDLVRFRPGSLSPTAWWATAGVVVLCTVGAYAVNSWALARTSASTTALFVYVQPVLAVSLAAAVLGERPRPSTFAAAALILAGVLLASWPGRPGPSRSGPGVGQGRPR